MKLSIAQRILIMVVIAAGVALVVGLVGIRSTNTMSQALNVVQSQTLPREQNLYKIQAQMLRMRVHILNHILASETDDFDKIEKAMKKSGDVLLDELTDYEKLVTDSKDRELVAADRGAIETFLGMLPEAVSVSRQNSNEEARKLVSGKVIPASSKANSLIDAHIKYLDETASAEREEANAAEHSARTTSISVIALSILLIGSLGYLIQRGIHNSLKATQAAITQIEHERDFRVRVPVLGHDEMAVMAQSLNRLIESMQGNLKKIYSSAGEVAVSAEHMSETAHQVAIASGQQSESASAMAAAIEELTVSISHVGDRAAEANQLSQESGKLANDGGKVIGQTVQDINEIASTVNSTSERIRIVETQSDKISSVVAVIREVADQTNLLALNAAIEAARAGEQGRGFAVVADEVRKLAERTASSTHEIASMIEGIRGGAKDAVVSMEQAVDRVSVGVARAGDASTAIDKIGNTSRQAVDMVGEITSAIREQSAASTNIAQRVEQIAQMAEESNAAASESSAAAQNLDKLAAAMQDIVATYKL